MTINYKMEMLKIIEYRKLDLYLRNADVYMVFPFLEQVTIIVAFIRQYNQAQKTTLFCICLSDVSQSQAASET